MWVRAGAGRELTVARGGWSVLLVNATVESAAAAAVGFGADGSTAHGWHEVRAWRSSDVFARARLPHVSAPCIPS